MRRLAIIMSVILSLALLAETTFERASITEHVDALATTAEATIDASGLDEGDELEVTLEGCCAKTDGVNYTVSLGTGNSRTVPVIAGRYHVHAKLTNGDGVVMAPESVVISNETREEHARRKANETGRPYDEVLSVMEESEWSDNQIDIEVGS